MYSIAERTQLSRKIAQISHIDTYRTMLKGYGSKRAGRIIPDKQQLAESLVYELLGKCPVEEILERTAGNRGNFMQNSVHNIVATVKKKLQNMRNTLLSVGKILMTHLFKLLTSYLQTASTVIKDFAKSIGT